MTFKCGPSAKYMCAVSVIEPRSLNDDNVVTAPTALTVDCKKGEARGIAAMGDKNEKFINGVLVKYMTEFYSKKDTIIRSFNFQASLQ